MQKMRPPFRPSLIGVPRDKGRHGRTGDRVQAHPRFDALSLASFLVDRFEIRVGAHSHHAEPKPSRPLRRHRHATAHHEHGATGAMRKRRHLHRPSLVFEFFATPKSLHDAHRFFESLSTTLHLASELSVFSGYVADRDDVAHAPRRNDVENRHLFGELNRVV